MVLTINKRGIIQYVLLYMLIITNGALIYTLKPQWIDLFIFIISGLVVLGFHRESDIRFGVCSVFFFGAGIVLLRIYSGGVGLSVFFKYASRILGVLALLCIDKQKLATRFFRLVYLFSLISIVFFVFGIIMPDALQEVLRYQSTNDVYKGILFYSAQLPISENTRNIGIFTEPAIYAIVLLSALYLFFYKTDSIHISKRKKLRMGITILIALATTMSTTGYICFAIMIIFYIFRYKNEYKKIFMRILIALVVLVFADFLIRGDSSFVMVGLINKITDVSGSVDINATTGKYRTASIVTYLKIFFENPFGVGYDNSYNILVSTNEFGEAAAGGGLLQDLASLGIICFSSIMSYIIYLFNKNAQTRAEVFMLVVVYVILATAQSSMLYVAFCIVAAVGNPIDETMLNRKK